VFHLVTQGIPHLFLTSQSLAALEVKEICRLYRQDIDARSRNAGCGRATTFPEISRNSHVWRPHDREDFSSREGFTSNPMFFFHDHDPVGGGTAGLTGRLRLLRVFAWIVRAGAAATRKVLQPRTR
jgi:hypothetical protein